ncbi:endo alpha-1,4 polygalactosaminidase [Paractinoplanes atraurantiacus]|uniref:Glycoside-hydrolase family GH114 n=1 Tax=Paractinoplanes atraurantiacus TaxID=1036182 RepID=A0A285JNP6_9ACTN|nr:endo alpha-1,4 polygalactosaminidase [Actinoplanes atraurantiacus]SNY60946.1 Glycoside-hydrolase family GH114 [Actinoplanes atraurantiacus]
MRRILAAASIAAVLAAAACDGADPEPVRSPSGPNSAAARGWAAPPANGLFDYQLGGAYQPAAGVTIVDRDRTAPALPDIYGICYVNAYQTQPGENDWWQAEHPDLVLKKEDPDWPGEHLLDISTPAKRAALGEIVGGWFAGCAASGFRAVEPDNLDSYTRSGGLLSEEHAVAYAQILVVKAHESGLAIGQKNAADFDGRRIGFDFAVTEECAVYDECGTYLGRYGDQVYEIEYTDNGIGAYRQACRDHGARISIILRDRDVIPQGEAGYHYESC